MLDCREISASEKENWNAFVRQNLGGSFLQSFDWGEFQAGRQARVWRLAVEEGGKWLAVAQAYELLLKFKQTILYVPRGPIFNGELTVDLSREVWDALLNKLEQMAMTMGALSLIVEPPAAAEELFAYLDKRGFQKSSEDIQPRHTLILDIRPPAEDLLKNMHQKTRYNINIAEKKGVTVEIDKSKFKEFHELLKNTSARQNIQTQGAEYFKKLLAAPFSELYLAKVGNDYAAALILINFGDTATYLFGASDYQFRDCMAPHLLQWTAIKESRARGVWFYDFWGAAPAAASGRENNWAGFTRFKMGFAPRAELTEYPGAFEKNFQPVKLGVYRFLQTLKKTFARN